METHRTFFRLLVSLLVALPFYSKKGCGTYDSNGSVGRSLHQDDVDAVMALLRSTTISLRLTASQFSRFDCGNVLYMSTIKCDNSNTRVTEIDFSSQQIEGELPEEIGKLAHLTTLDLSGNMLRGPIPKSLGNLASLKKLALDDNWFNDTIPSELGRLASLEILSLGNNLFSGKIPKELGNISNLLELQLRDNMLEGQLPDELGNLANLQALYLMNNGFSGILPSSFQKLQKLQSFNVRGNNLSGILPNVNSPDLLYMRLVGNSFEGPFPGVFPASKKLFILEVTNLVRGEEGFQFPNVGELTMLTSLSLRNCSLIGSIPKYIWQLRYLSYLDLSFNRLTGGIPASITNEPKYIFLRSNKLNQSLPRWLIQTTTSYVDVSENLFTDESLPTENVSQNLNLFACCSNISNVNQKWQQAGFHCSNEKLKYDNLYINCGGDVICVNGSNNYEADLKSEGGSTFFLRKSGRWGYSSMGTVPDASQDRYIFNKTCNLTMADAPLYQTARGAPISLKYYGFCLRNDIYTVKLHFAEIAWEAHQVSGSKDRRVFDVEIQGKNVLSNFNIETEAGGVNLNVTREFNVPVNESRLEIHLYWTGKGSRSHPTLYFGPLISAISVSPVRKEHKKLSSAAIAGIGASAALFVILSLVLFWQLGWFAGKKDEGTEVSPGGVFSFQEIKAATQNFSAANKLGEGGFGPVYKGILPNGTEIAVKKLSAKSKQGSAEFVTALGVMLSLRHPHLVELKGRCENQLLLIYEYMKNNSLHHALFGPGELKERLNWRTRVKICLGIAKGLAFLHEESKINLIHSAIKPTNILLDEDLNAKISDFGYAKLFKEEKAHVVTRIHGYTIHMAPEYAIKGSLSTKADVYSFGVVTLEIVSGRNSDSPGPNDQSDYLLNKACMLKEQGKLAELIDPDLGSQYDWKEANTILQLAMLCLNHSPMVRPPMSDVVQVLKGKKKIETIMLASALSQSTHAGSSSQVEPESSSTVVSQSVCKEIELSSKRSSEQSEITKWHHL